MNQKQAAEALGLKPASLRQWLKEPGCPQPLRGQYDLQALRAWRDARARKGSPEGDQTQKLKMAELAQKVRTLTLRNASLEHRVQVETGELLIRGDWETFASTLLAKLGDLCEQLPDLIANELPAKHRKAISKRLAMELAAWRTDTADELARGPLQSSK